MTRTLTLLRPLAGLPHAITYTLEAIDTATGLHALRATEQESRLFVLAAETCLPGYRPIINDEQATSLGLTEGADAEVFTIVNPAADPTTVNLLAPIVVNRATDAATQVILEGQSWPHDAPLSEVLSA